jgi:hypothetical protein
LSDPPPLPLLPEELDDDDPLALVIVALATVARASADAAKMPMNNFLFIIIVFSLLTSLDQTGVFDSDNFHNDHMLF